MNASKSTNPTTVKGLSHLHIACAKNNLDLIRKFLKNKISIDTKVDFKSDKFPGFSALHFAVGFGQIEVVKLLLQYGANVNSKDATESTPLHLASFHNYLKLNELKETYFRDSEKIRIWIKNCGNQVKIVKLLLDYKADVNAKNIIGATPLYYAFGNKLIKNELKNSNLINTITKYIRKLHIRQKEIIDLLISHNADVNSCTFSGSSILHNASAFMNNEYHFYDFTLITLLLADCNVDVKDKEGKTPLHLACQSKNHEVVFSLLYYGADVNILDNDKQTVFCSMNLDSLESYSVFSELGKHLKKMMTLGYYISDEVKRSYTQVYNQLLNRENNYSHCNLNFKDDEFSMKCRQEIEKMKKVKLNSYSTLYDTLHKDSNEMAKYIKNKRIKRILTSNISHYDFPIYGKFLKLRFRKARARDGLLNPAKEALNFATKIGFPDPCSEEIFKYLTNNDLKSFIECISTVRVPKRKLTTNNIVDSGPSLKRSCLL